MKITRPPVSHERISDVFYNRGEDLPHFLDSAQRNPENLTLLTREFIDLACCGSMVEPESPLIDVGLRLAAQALAGLFKVVNAKGDPVDVRFLDRAITLAGRVATHETVSIDRGSYKITEFLPVGSGKIDQGLVHDWNWAQAFYLCSLCREKDLIGSLCETPIPLLRRSSTVGPEYGYVRVDALKAFANQAGDAESQILAVLKTIEIERPSLRKPAWAILLERPAVELLLHLQRGDEKAFAAGLPRALKAHKKYWTKTEQRRLDWDGFLSVPLLAVAALAWDRGFRFEVESEYLPMRLICGEFRSADIPFAPPPTPPAAEAPPAVEPAEYCVEDDPCNPDEVGEREENFRQGLLTRDNSWGIEGFEGAKLIFSETDPRDLDQVYEKGGRFAVVHHRVNTDPGKVVSIPGSNLAQAGSRKFLERTLERMIERGGRGEEIARQLEEALKAGKIFYCHFHWSASERSPGNWQFDHYTVGVFDISS